MSIECPASHSTTCNLQICRITLKSEKYVPGQFSPKVEPAGNTILRIKLDSPKLVHKNVWSGMKMGSIISIRYIIGHVG
jgi:hypothetical protein